MDFNTQSQTVLVKAKKCLVELLQRIEALEGVIGVRTGNEMYVTEQRYPQVRAALLEVKRQLYDEMRETTIAPLFDALKAGDLAGIKRHLHGDYYPGSWLRSDDGGVSIIDPEFAFIGPAEFDVGVLMAHLYFAGFNCSAISAALDNYRGPANFDFALAERFAGMEMIRRLLGIAQLPLSAEDQTRAEWLTTGADLLMNG